MGVVPRRFFCIPCKKERWPGDCEHARVVSDLSEMKLFSRQALFDDVCRGCGESPRGCNCPAQAKNLRSEATASAIVSRVFALSGCPCRHHVTAYLVDDVKGTITCGTCCSNVTAFSTGEASAIEDKIDNAGRRSIGLHILEKAIAFGLETGDRKLACDPRMPGWISNGHFIAYAGDEAADMLLKTHDSYSCEIFDQFKAWEATGRGLSVHWADVRCEPKEKPVDMIGWGKRGWTNNRKRGMCQDAVTIVAPTYSDVICGESTCREHGKDDDPLAMLVRWEWSKISAAAMPRCRETIIE